MYTRWRYVYNLFIIYRRCKRI